MADAHKNFGYSTVATAPSPATSGTSLVVQTGDGAKFPTPPFNATVWPVGANPLASNAEIVRVTGISTDTFTIVRTQESSSARTIGIGDQIANTITVKTLTDVEQMPVGGGLSGTLPSPSVLTNNYINKISTLLIVGHSYTRGTTQVDSGTANMYRQGMIPRLQGLLAAGEMNVTHLGQAGERISGTQNALTSSWFSGWSGVAQFVLPDNQKNVDAANDIVISDPVVSDGGAGIIVHGCNDFPMMFATTTDSPTAATQNILAAGNAYRYTLSRMRAGVVYGSIVNAGSIVWDSSIAFTGTWSDIASVQQNTGPAYKQTSTNTDSFTITLPTNFTGGVVAVNLIAQTAGVTHLTGNVASSGGVTLGASTAANFPQSGTMVVKIGSEEMVVTAGFGTTSWTVNSADRGVNGTVAAAHSTLDIIQTATDAHKVTWSGTVAAATGTTSISGQGSALSPVGVTKRFVCTPADAGKTITGTVSNFITHDTSASLQFDSWQIESSTPKPIAMSNLHDYNYGTAILDNQTYINAFNTGIASVVSEFDSYVQIADVYTPFFNRNGFSQTALTTTAASTTLNGAITSGAASMVVTAATNFPSSGQYYAEILAEGANTTEYVLITAGQGTTTWTITRAQLGSAASAHATSAVVKLLISWTANSSSYTPSVGLIMTFGRSTGEDVLLTKVLGTSPNLVFEVTRGANGTSLAAHTANLWLGSADWMFTDKTHPNSRGHSVYAQALYSALVAMPAPSIYQVAESQGNWSQGSQLFSMGIIDNGYKYPMTNAMATGNAGANTLTFCPVYIPQVCSVVEIGIATTAINASPSTLRFGIWLPDATHSRPGRLLQEIGTVTSAVSVSNGLTGCYQICKPGYYWLGVVQQGGGAPSTLRTISTLGLSFPDIMSSTPLAAVGMVGFSQSSVTGALSDVGTLSDQTASGNVARLYVRLRGKLSA